MKIRKDKADSCGDISLESLGTRSHEETLVAKEGPTGNKHPTPEQLMVREAAKWLTSKQKKVWELYNYDRFTQDEIAKKLGITQQGVAKHIKAIEKRIAKWIGSNLGAYNLLKTNFEEKQ